MGCSTSTQTSAVDTTRPSTKPEESNGASATGAANENGKVADDSETIPDQTPAQGGDAKPADDSAAAPPAGGEAAEAAPAEAADSSAEPAAAGSEEEKADAAAAGSEEAPAPSE